MKVKYTKNGQFYVLSNFSVSSNPLFMNKEDIKNFKKRVKAKLSALCEIYGFRFLNDQYELLVKLKDRQSFVEFYKIKKNKKDLRENEIPDSSYILSQEMANIQSGYAKWFNHKYKRFGCLFGRRYTKVFLRNITAFKKWMLKFKDKWRFWLFRDFWSYEECYLSRWDLLVRVDMVDISIGTYKYLRGHLKMNE